MNEGASFEQLKQVIRTLERYETLEIKRNDKGQIDVTRKSTQKYIVTDEDA